VPNWTAPNQTMWGQTKFCIAKSSSEIITLLRYYATYSSNFILIFQDIQLDPPSKSRNPKDSYTENYNFACEISGFHNEVAKNCTLLGYYAVSSGNFLPILAA
jgi:hypothetical protein